MITLNDFDNDGSAILAHLIAGSVWKTLAQAIASLSVFAHPDVVYSLGSRAVFRTMRGNIRDRGKIIDGVMIDDNYSPATAFIWATGFRRGSDLHCCHLYTASDDPSAYTDVRNIFFAPTFLAKLTDYQTKSPSDDHLTHLLRYRAWKLYGYCGPSACEPPQKPSVYDSLEWAYPLGAGATPSTLKAVFLNRVARRPKDRLTYSANALGWTFSDYAPDEKVAYLGSVR